MEEIKLTDAQLEAALRCCAKSEASACKKCPMGLREDDGKCCFDALRLMAALRLEELAEENRRLRDATEGYVAELARQMADMARECNTARERGLPKVSGDYVLALNQIQEKLVALGRGSVIAAEPMDGGWRVTGITVEGRAVFSAEYTEKESVIANQSADWCGDPVDHAECVDGAARNIEGIATSPAAPRNDMETGGPDG